MKYTPRPPLSAAALLALAPLAGSTPQGLATLGEQFKLTASDAESGDELGTSVSLCGDTALVGVPHEDTACPIYGACNSGAAYVFVFDGTAWSEQAKLTPSDGAQWDEFGHSVALFGDTAVIGNRDAASQNTVGGSVYVFTRSGTSWSEEAKLNASDASPGDGFGLSVAVYGDTLIAGAPFANPGSAYVFTRSGTSWSEGTELTAFDPGSSDRFGSSVALFQDTALVGSRDDDHSGLANAGSAYVFDRAGTTWSLNGKLTAGAPEAHDHFGSATALSDGLLVVGCPQDKSGSTSVGSAYVFARDNTGWSEEARLVATGGASNDLFGDAVAVSGNLVVAGVWGDTHLAGGTGGSQGSAHAFRRVAPGVFTAETKLFATDGNAAGRFGYAVAADGNRALIGSPWKHQYPPLLSSGAAYVHDLSALFAATSYCTAGVSASGCQALLSASGEPSASAASGFVALTANVEGAKDGLFFYGASGRQANAWGNGTSFQCVMPPIRRGGLLTGSGTTGQCDGSFSQDLNARWCPTCPKPRHNPGAGTTAQAQLWYRDPANTGNQSTSLSDAIEFVVGL